MTKFSCNPSRRMLSVRTALSLAVLPAFFFLNHSVSAQERVLGVDISYWNCGTSSGGISQANWNTGFSTGNRKFAYIRATRGGTTGLCQTAGTPGGGSQETLSERYDDSRFIQNITRASAAGMMTAPYHFARPDVAGNTGDDEANHFIQMAGPWMRPGYMMPMYDMEAGQSLGGNALVQFSIDFSDRIYEAMRIRPCIYINGSYSGTFSGANQTLRDLAAKPRSATPSVIGPAFPMLWNARYSDNSNPDEIPVQTGDPKTTYTTISSYYGPWDDYGDTDPWSFWQYSSTVSVPGFNNVDNNIDCNVSHGDIEYVRNYLIPAVWWGDNNGDWGTLANWNSGQTVVAPVTPADQADPYATGPLPISRLPGASGTGPTSGQYDTVILERPTANITVTLSGGTNSYNIRKLYMRETLNIVNGASLTINYDPTYRADDSSLVLHGGPISAQFSGAVSMTNANLSVHTLRVDGTNTLSLNGGTLTFNTIQLYPGNTAAKILMNGNITLNPLANASAVVAKGPGSGTTGWFDLNGAVRTFTIGNGTNAIDVSFGVRLNNGGIIKNGSGTLKLTTNSSYASGTTVSAGRLLVSNPSGSGTGTGPVTVATTGTLGGTGIISGAVTVNSGGTISPGESGIGLLTLGSSPTFSGTNFMEINRNGGSSLADKITVTVGTLNYGGTLLVTNIGAALVGGEVFTNFSASAYAGSFANTVLPPLSAGLNWYLGALPTNGTIRVNRSPVASSATFTNDPTQVLKIPIANLVSAATDADGNALALGSFGPSTTNGIPLVSSNSFILYTNNASVADRFTFTINDGRGGSATNTVQIVPSPLGRFAGQPTVNGGSLTLNFTGLAGWTYYVERSINLTAWTTVSTNVASANGSFSFTDPSGTKPAFYRLRWAQ